MDSNPSIVAREALRQLASLRLPPTPDNYARVYNHIADPGVRPAPAGALAMLRELTDDLQRAPDDPVEEAAALRRAIDHGDWLRAKALLRTICVGRDATAEQPTWASVLRDLLAWWELRTPGMSQARKRDMVEHVLTAFAYSADALSARLAELVRIDRQHAQQAGDAAPAAAVDAPSTPTAAAQPCAAAGDPVVDTAPAAHVAGPPSAAAGWTDDAWKVCRDLLAEAIVVDSEACPEELAQEAQVLAGACRGMTDAADLAELSTRLRRFWSALTRVSLERKEIQQGLLRLLQLLTANVSELVGDAAWMRGQLKALNALATGPLTIDTIVGLERGLREIAQRQSVLKASLDQAKDAMKQMVATFIERMGALAANAGGYHDRLEGYAREIEAARDVTELSSVIVHVMQDTRTVQSDLGKSRDELLAARRTVEQFQERATRLESELIVLSDRLQEDQLTQVLNRRGLDHTYETEAARADRYHRPLSLAMLDVDNFKALNDRLGHQAGDSALVHLTASIRQSLRTTDIIARYGGEEFVVLLPETACDDALAVMMRVQRELTRRFFLHNNERVLITFSAGVAERIPGEVQEDLIARADRALYQAKVAGKNRVMVG